MKAGERLLKQKRATVGRLRPAAKKQPRATQTVRIGRVEELRKWIRASARQLGQTRFVLGLKSEMETQRRALAALQSLGVEAPHLLTSTQDQIFVLDRNHRMVAFFGQWPKESLSAASPLRNQAGAIAGVLLVTRNVTELRPALLDTHAELQVRTRQLLEVESASKRCSARRASIRKTR